MIELSQNSNFIKIFMIMTTSVYFSSETLQLSKLISESSHNPITTSSFTYDLLYSWLVSYVVFKMSNIIKKEFPSNIDILKYFVCFNLGAIGFALLGEVPCLHNIAIVPNFWNHLGECAKITIITFAIIIIILGLFQLKKTIEDKDCIQHFVPYLLFIFFYSIILLTLISGKAKGVTIHVHHAIFASILSYWFTDWNSQLSMLFHGILMGVIVEGINFYFIHELSLFLCDNSMKMKLTYMLPIWILWLFICIFIKFFSNKIYKENKKFYILSN